VTAVAVKRGKKETRKGKKKKTQEQKRKEERGQAKARHYQKRDTRLTR